MTATAPPAGVDQPSGFSRERMGQGTIRSGNGGGRLETIQRPSLLWLRQAVKFGIVGVLNTAVDLGTYFVLTRWLGMAGLPVAAKGISYSLGILNSFFWNKTWTFRSNASTWKTLVPFFLVSLIGLGMNAGGMQLGLNVLHLPELVALALATVFALAWNFVLSKFVIFRR
jgi:putative flippase GtrA